jgi:hypothetical protein
VGEFALKDFDLGEKLLFDVFGHPRSMAGSKVAHSAGDKNLDFSLYAGCLKQLPASSFQPLAGLAIC